MAMAGELAIKIIGNAENLKSALGEAESKVGSFADKVGKIGKIATIAGAAVTGAFAAIITKTAQAGDQFDKMSLRTGIAVEDLSALSYAADISGTSIETMEKGLKGLTKVMDDASMGIGEGMEAFELLDIAVVDSDGNLRSTIDVLKEAAAKISAIENPTKQAALAMDLFGARAGPELLPLLKAGEGGIEELMNRAKELGITMSTEAAAKAAEFTDRMTDLQGSLAGAGRTIGDVLIPAIIPLIEKATEMVGKVAAWAEENEPLVETLTKVAAVVGVLGAVGGPILMAVAAFMKIQGAITAIGTVATGPIGILILAIGAVYLAWKNWDKIVEFVQEWSGKIVGFLISLKDLAVQKVKELIDMIIEKFKELADLPKKMLEWGKKAIEGFADGIKGAMGKVTDAVKGVGNKILDFFKPGSPTREGPLSIGGGTEQWGYDLIENYALGMNNATELVYQASNDLAEGTMTIFTKLKDEFKTNIVDPIMGYLENQLANAIVGLLDNTSDFEWSWKNFWEGLKNTLINAVAAMIAKLIVLASFSWLFGILGLPVSWLPFEKGGGAGYQFGGEVKRFQAGGLGTDTIPAWLTPGEYVISKPMTDFIRKFQTVPQNLIQAISQGMPTPAPLALAGGGTVGTPNITAQGFGETKIYVDIHDNKISDDVDIRQLAKTVSDEILRKIELRRKH